MPLTLQSFSEWTPEILRKLYVSRQERQQESPDNDLLEKLVSDPRMKSAWNAISRRSKNENYPIALFIMLAAHIKTEEPRELPKALKKRYSKIADQARRLDKDMKDTELEGGRVLVSAIAESADQLAGNGNQIALMVAALNSFEPAKNVDTKFWPYLDIDRLTVNPRRTMLARWLHHRFTRDFGTPLWETIAILVEVVCDAPPDKVTIDWVRHCCTDCG